MHPDAVSAKRKCLVQCSKPSIDLKSGFPDFTSSDFHVHKVFQLMKFLMNFTLDRFTQGVFKRIEKPSTIPLVRNLPESPTTTQSLAGKLGAGTTEGLELQLLLY